MRSKKYLLAFSLVTAIGLAACSTVESTGEGVAKAGTAVGNAGQAVGRGIGDVISATGETVDEAAERTRRRGY